MNKLISLLLIIGMMMAVAPVTLGQEANPTIEYPTIECTSEIGCRVLLDAVELPILIAQADTLSGPELKEALKSFRKEFTGGIRTKYVLSIQGDDISLLYVQEDEGGNILGLIILSEEWGWLEVDPNQERKLQDVFDMAYIIKHLIEVSTPSE